MKKMTLVMVALAAMLVMVSCGGGSSASAAATGDTPAVAEYKKLASQMMDVLKQKMADTNADAKMQEEYEAKATDIMTKAQAELAKMNADESNEAAKFDAEMEKELEKVMPTK